MTTVIAIVLLQAIYSTIPKAAFEDEAFSLPLLPSQLEDPITNAQIPYTFTKQSPSPEERSSWDALLNSMISLGGDNNGAGPSIVEIGSIAEMEKRSSHITGGKHWSSAFIVDSIELGEQNSIQSFEGPTHTTYTHTCTTYVHLYIGTLGYNTTDRESSGVWVGLLTNAIQRNSSVALASSFILTYLSPYASGLSSAASTHNHQPHSYVPSRS